MSARLKDLTDKTFGQLYVIGLNEIIRKPGETRPYWDCRCACGKQIKVRGDVLRDGRKTDCGCKTASRPNFKQSILKINGVSKTAAQWASYYGIKPFHIYDRLRYGMDVEQAITTPVGKRGHRIRKNSFCTSAGQ